MESKSFSTWTTVVIGAVSMTIFLLLWQLAVMLWDISPATVPSPVAVGKALFRADFLLSDIWTSTRRVFLGFAMAILVATPLGLVMGINRWVRVIFNPILSLIRPLPSMSWIPISMMWFGIDEEQKVYIIFMGCFASVLVYTIEATVRVDSTLRRAALNLGASRTQEIFQVILPAALPQLLGGLKVIMAIAWTCVISAEMVGATSGLGYVIINGNEYGNTALIFAGMMGISVTVLLLDIAFRGLEWALLPYQRGTQ
jgi:taurine transport system permease protein